MHKGSIIGYMRHCDKGNSNLLIALYVERDAARWPPALSPQRLISLIGRFNSFPSHSRAKFASCNEDGNLFSGANL